jgi:hypothetical protein
LRAAIPFTIAAFAFHSLRRRIYQPLYAEPQLSP